MMAPAEEKVTEKVVAQTEPSVVEPQVAPEIPKEKTLEIIEDQSEPVKTSEAVASVLPV